MFVFRNQSRRATACRALVALIGATGALAAVAYAASSSPPPAAGGAHPRVAGSGAAVLDLRARPGVPRPPRPRLARHPAKTTLSSRVSFRYVSRWAGVAFHCKLDSDNWKRCGPRVAYRGLAVGAHRFLVRAEAERGGRSLPTRFDWVQAEPKPFSIQADLSALGGLYPGAAPAALPLVLTNPNSAPILVTAIKVAVTAEPAGCASGENLALVPAGVSRTRPLKIPAGASVSLPAQGLAPPAIALRDLPVNQDACQGARFPLAFSGEAHG
jgi:hypothetical protein